MRSRKRRQLGRDRRTDRSRVTRHVCHRPDGEEHAGARGGSLRRLRRKERKGGKEQSGSRIRSSTRTSANCCERRRRGDHRDARLPARRAFRGCGQIRQAHLHREARVGGRGRLQAHHAGGRCGGPEAEHHLRLSAALRAGVPEGQAARRFRSDSARSDLGTRTSSRAKAHGPRRRNCRRPRQKWRRSRPGTAGRIFRAI